VKLDIWLVTTTHTFNGAMQQSIEKTRLPTFVRR
jgi:hypothetical protein